MNEQPPRQVWSDEAIVNTIEADATFDGNCCGEGIWVLVTDEAIEIAKQIRDDYEAALTAAQQEVAQLRQERDALKLQLAECQQAATALAMLTGDDEGADDE